MDYGDDAMAGALGAEKTFSEFFHNVKAAMRRSTPKVCVLASVPRTDVHHPMCTEIHGIESGGGCSELNQ